MQTFRERTWLRILTRKPLKRVPLRAVISNWWQLYRETVKQRAVFLIVAVFAVLFWVAVMSLAEYVTQRGAM